MKTATVSIVYVFGLCVTALAMWITPLFAEVPDEVKDYTIIGGVLAVAVREVFRLGDAKKIDALTKQVNNLNIEMAKIQAVDDERAKHEE